MESELSAYESGKTMLCSRWRWGETLAGFSDLGRSWLIWDSSWMSIRSDQAYSGLFCCSNSANWRIYINPDLISSRNDSSSRFPDDRITELSKYTCLLFLDFSLNLFIFSFRTYICSQAYLNPFSGSKTNSDTVGFSAQFCVSLLSWKGISQSQKELSHSGTRYYIFLTHSVFVGCAYAMRHLILIGCNIGYFCVLDYLGFVGL